MRYLNSIPDFLNKNGHFPGLLRWPTFFNGGPNLGSDQSILGPAQKRSPGPRKFRCVKSSKSVFQMTFFMKIPRYGLFTEFYKANQWLGSAAYAGTSLFTITQYLGQTLISFNRFTSLWMPVYHKRVQSASINPYPFLIRKLLRFGSRNGMSQC